MGRLRTLTILLTLGAWGATTDGAPPAGVATSTGAPARAPLQVPAGEYLKAGTRLISTGQNELAARYLKVATDYRDQLSPADQAQLDATLAKMSPAAAPAPALADPAVMPASATSAPPAASPSSGRARGTGDTKQEARWKLQGAREQLARGNYDEASRIVAQVRTMDVKWGLFDETPDKMDEAIAKARPKGAASASGGPRDRRTAQAKLKEARDLLASNQFEQAEALALEVESWNLSYGIWEDKPSKVAAAARALRRRDMTRALPLKAQPSQTIYDVLVQESRQLMAAGQLDQAEAKARQALQMNVVPDTDKDRAEAVLNDISVARSKGVAPVAGTPAAEPASVVAERAANDLLAKGNRDAAAAKFVEAEQLRTREMAQPPAAALDPAIRRVENVEPPALEPQPLALAPAEAAAPPALEPGPAALPELGANVDPSAPPAPLPAPEPVEGLPGAPSINPDPAPAGNKGEDLLFQARSLFGQGNYPAAREKAEEAKAGGFGVDAQADEMIAQIALSEQGGALAAYEAALDAVRKSEFDKARQLLTEVAASGAAIDEAMMQKVQDLLLKLPQEGAGKATASDVPTSDAEALRAQKLNAEVSTRVAEARRLMETDPDQAIALLQKTLDSVKAAELPQAVARTMTRRLEVAIELAKKDKVAFDLKMQDKNARAEVETKKLRILEADKAKKAAVSDLMKRAEEAMAQGEFAKAEELSRRALEIKPDELSAVMLSFKANTQRHYEQYTRDKKAKEEGALTALQDVDAAMIIDPALGSKGITYPENFRVLAENRRKAQLAMEPKKDPKVLAIEKKLNEPITVNFTEATLNEAVTFISNYTGLNVVLDSKALNDEGLSRDSKVSLQLNGVSLKTALKLMLRPLGLTYKADQEVLMITSPLATRENTYAWTYPVADLVVSPAKANGSVAPGTPATTFASGMDPAVMATGGASTANGNAPTTSVQRSVTIADMMPLVQLITTTIAPNTWRVTDVGGGGGTDGSYGMGGAFGAAGDEVAQPGSITPFMLSISLIIRHTAEVHEEVAELLKQLRRLQDLQVSIEVRFITVSDDFFEQIGVDFDFNIQSDVLGPKSTFAAQNPNVALFPNGNTGGGLGGGTTGGGTTGGTTGGGTTGTTGASFSGGGGLGGGAGGFAGGGGGVGGAGIGTGGGGGGGGVTGGTPANLVNPFLDHSLGSRQPLVVGLASPGLKNFTGDLGIPFINGGGSVISQTQTFNSIPTAGATFGISFLSDLEMYLFLTAAQGDARNNIVQAPKITTFNGANATIYNNDVRYYVSQTIPLVGPNSVALQPQIGQLNDGVQLSVTPVVSSDRRYVRLSLNPIFNAVTGLTTFQGGSGAVGGSGLGGQGTSVQGTIQLPEFTQTTLTTTVTVPDGGTVLLGGVKRMREQRLEYGVPVLAKTPMINRLFRNIGIGRRTDSLMLMVTPKIIILEEEEERLGVRTVNPNP